MIALDFLLRVLIYKLLLSSFFVENDNFKRLSELEMVANVRKISGVEGIVLYL